MAPEFFGFILLSGLVLMCPAILIIALLPRKFRERLYPVDPDWFRQTGLKAVFAVLLIAGLLGWYLYQQFGLNEPLAIAARQGDSQQVTDLLSRGASPNSWGIDGVDTALTAAVESGKVELVKILLDKGAKPDMSNGNGQTPLSIARTNGKREIEEVLVQSGAKK